mmetsp:Transcript_30350/g.94442  ORF Transcript_30350/g.94442 Transcript_30350/m.94442 type:complete len:207 (+) Transcript_30350:565-1185(+)
MDARDLDGESELAFKSREGRVCLAQDRRAVLLQGREVPVQKEAAVLRGVTALEEGRVARLAVVGAGIARRRGPGAVARLRGVGLEAGEGVLVPALEGPDAAELPAAQLVRGVAQLARGPGAKLQRGDRVAEVFLESSREGVEPAAVHLQGRAALDRDVVREEGDVLFVLVAVVVLVPDAVGPRDEGRQRDVAGVAYVAAALVEGRH